MEKTMMAQPNLLPMAERRPAREFVKHVQGSHPKKDGDKNDGSNDK